MAEKNLYINQIFKGWSASQYFGVEGTYNSSAAIDPDLPIVSTDVRTSGFPVPVGSETFSGANITRAVVSQVTQPKNNLLWTIQTNGKIVTFKSDLTGERLIGTVAGSNAVWAEYYNNYIYVFGTGALKDDISRIGPLNTLPYDTQTGNYTVGLTVTGATSGATGIITADVDAGLTGTLTLSNINGHFVDNEIITDTSTGSSMVNRTDASLIVDNVWKGATLGTQTALTNTKYPTFRGVDMPNHVAHNHSDGSLYFCDFKNGQGYIHRINTRTVTNEGDTNGSTVPSLYNALDLPFGFYPTDLTNYGTDILIIGIYQTDTTTNQGRSAAVIWDPTNTSSFHTGPIPFADPIASAVLNANGTVYIWTGNAQNGVRLSIYNGGVSVRELVFQEEGLPPYAGAIDSFGNRVVWGGHATYPSIGAYVYAYGSKRADLPVGLHNISSSTVASSNTVADSYATSNYSGSINIQMDGLTSSSLGKGQSFTGAAGLLTKAQFLLRLPGAATGTVVAKLYAHSGVFGTSSIPTGTALAVSTNSIDVSTITILSTSTLYDFIFDGTYTLVAGTKYVLTIEIQNTGSGTLYALLNNSTPTHAGNRSFYSSGTNTWSASTSDLIFYVYVDQAGVDANITSLRYVQQSSNVTPKVVTAWRNSTTTGVDKYSNTATLDSKIRWLFNIGSKYEITRVSIPLAGAVASGTIITPSIYIDDESTTRTLNTINNTNYPARRKVTYKGSELKNTVGYNNFIFEIAYTGTDPLPVALPIIITVDIKSDEQ